jgi:hypothetical protein
MFPVWRAYFAQLYVRTGGAVGASSGQIQADLDAEEAARQAADLALTTGLAAERAAREAADSAEAAARAAADAGLLPLAGGTMTGTGMITLSAGAPTNPRHAVGKGYVDSAVSGVGGVSSFNTRTGAVTLLSGDITGAGGALLASPVFTGNPQVPTAAAGDADTTAASTAFVAAAQRNANCADNSGFSVNQRTYVSGTARSVGLFAHDRWKAGSSGCTYTFTQSPGPSTTVTITAGSLQQVIEGASLVGGDYMLSWTGTAQGRVGAGAYGASPVAVTGVTAGANTTIEFNAGTLGQVKFEAGTVATQWAAAAPAHVLAGCQRFYSVMTGGVIGGYADAAGRALFLIYTFPTTMRATPSIAFSAITNVNSTGPSAANMGAGNVLMAATAAGAGGMTSTFTMTATADL